MSTVTPVTEGETITLHGPEGEPTTYTVGPCCGENNGRWLCVTHEASFANQLQKDSHISGVFCAEGGEHVLAWVCIEHGLEVP